LKLNQFSVFGESESGLEVTGPRAKAADCKGRGGHLVLVRPTSEKKKKESDLSPYLESKKELGYTDIQEKYRTRKRRGGVAFLLKGFACCSKSSGPSRIRFLY